MLSQIAMIATNILAITSLCTMLIKPIRNKIFGYEKIVDGQKCMLRSEIVRTYYNHKDEKTIRQYEFENMEMCYQAYIALHGNTFVKKIHDEMMEWEVIS